MARQQLSPKYQTPEYQKLKKTDMYDLVLEGRESYKKLEEHLQQVLDQVSSLELQASQVITITKDEKEEMERTKKDCVEAAKLMNNLQSQIKTLETSVESHKVSLAESQQKLDDNQYEIDCLKETVDEYEAGPKPMIIPLFGEDRISIQSSLALGWEEHTKEWNIAGSQLRNAYKEYAPRIFALIDSIVESLRAIYRRAEALSKQS